jgi:hypothetical protein
MKEEIMQELIIAHKIKDYASTIYWLRKLQKKRR